jgi:hypothetical protein
MVADLLTKPLAKSLFIALRTKLLNVSEKPHTPWSSASGGVSD